MQAVNCNRCGAFATVDKLHENPADILRNDIKDGRSWIQLILHGWEVGLENAYCYASGLRTKRRDLCPGCSSALQAFLRNEPVVSAVPVEQWRTERKPGVSFPTGLTPLYPVTTPPPTEDDATGTSR